MNLNEQNSSASDEVAAAEAELRAAQETLKAARARLSELKGEHPAVEPGAASSDVVGDGEPVEAFGVAAVVVDEDTAEIECVLTRQQLSDLVEELDRLCAKFPDRT